MSRWENEFLSHPFQSHWLAVKAEVPSLTIDDPTIVTNVEEVARLKKVIAYLSAMIDSIDPELVPRSTWDNFAGQAEGCSQQVRAYVSNRNIAHIQNANANADNLLSYLKPYMVLPAEAMHAVHDALQAYQGQIELHLKQVSAMAVEVGNASRDEITSLKQNAQIAQEKSREIDSLRKALLEGTPEQPSIKAEIESFQSNARTAEEEIRSYHQRLFTDTEHPSIKATIEALITSITRDNNAAQKTIQQTQEKVDELNIFYTKIFGEIDSSGSATSGLKQELEQRTKQLSQFETTQSEKYSAMYARIEGLLPGATSAGLATAYRALARSFGTKIGTNTRLFYGAVLAIPVIALIVSIQHVAVWPPSISFVEIKSYDELLRLSLFKIPFIAPFVWLAIFASMRRSQYERLQQEYSHKEALAKSYESYKKQLDALQVPDIESLKKELITKAVEAIAYNASTTLGGNHREALPAEALLDFVRDEKNAGLLNQLKSLITPDKK